MLFSNSAPYIREILVHKPRRNPEPLANATQRWNRRFIERLTPPLFSVRSTFLNAGAVADQKIDRIDRAHAFATWMRSYSPTGDSIQPEWVLDFLPVHFPMFGAFRQGGRVVLSATFLLIAAQSSGNFC